MGISGVNAKRPRPMATASDKVPVSAMISGRFSAVAEVVERVITKDKYKNLDGFWWGNVLSNETQCGQGDPYTMSGK